MGWSFTLRIKGRGGEGEPKERAGGTRWVVEGLW